MNSLTISKPATRLDPSRTNKKCSETAINKVTARRPIVTQSSDQLRSLFSEANCLVAISNSFSVLTLSAPRYRIDSQNPRARFHSIQKFSNHGWCKLCRFYSKIARSIFLNDAQDYSDTRGKEHRGHRMDPPKVVRFSATSSKMHSGFRPVLGFRSRQRNSGLFCFGHVFRNAKLFES